MKAFMKARNHNNGSAIRYRNLLLKVVKIIHDEKFGDGILGTSYFNRQNYIVFSNPQKSEAKQKATMTNDMAGWIKGLQTGFGKFQITEGSVVLVQDNARRNDAPQRIVEVNGEKIEAQVVFTQWIKLWCSKEALENKESPKFVFSGYVIARAFPDRESNEENLRVDILLPNREADAKTNTKARQSIFSFSRTQPLLQHIEEECQKNPRIDFYMTRVRNAKTGKMVGQGEFIRARGYGESENTPTCQVFLGNLSKRLNLTERGVEQLLGQKDYIFEILPLYSYPVSKLSDKGETLRDHILHKSPYIPRENAQDGSKQSGYLAIPCGLRLSRTKQGFFILDRCIPIGKIGLKDGEFSEDSDVISADAYSGTLEVNKYGDPQERGIEIEEIQFSDGVASDMRSLAALLGCEQKDVPNGDMNDMYEVADEERAEGEYSDMDDVPF